jgi:hypothetical protein
MEHSIKERQYICLLLNRLFNRIHTKPIDNQIEVAMEWLFAIRQVDGVMLSIRGGYAGEPFCVNGQNNYECLMNKEYKRS